MSVHSLASEQIFFKMIVVYWISSDMHERLAYNYLNYASMPQHEDISTLKIVMQNLFDSFFIDILEFRLGFGSTSSAYST